jgi:hypothetical protein
MVSPETETPQKSQELDREPRQHSLQPASHSINNLPDELLLEIATYLEGDNQALGSLTQVSRRFKVIGGELLYRTINLSRSREDNTIYLVRTLIEKPDLGSKIRQLAFSTTIYGDNTLLVLNQAMICTNMYTAMLLQIAQSVNRLDLFETESPFESKEEFVWRSKLMIGLPNAVAGLLLALCDNLRMLHVNVYCQENLCVPTSDIYRALYGIEGDKVQHTPGHWSGFSQFRTIKRLRIFGESMRMLQLPFYSLQVLEIDLWREYSTTDAAYGEHESFANSVAQCLLPPYPNIDTLIVRSDWAELHGETHLYHDEQLPCLFQNLPQSTITHLEILFVRSPTAVKRWCGSFEYIARALSDAENVSLSLEYLKIDYEVSNHFDPRRCFGRCTNVPGLHSFSKLTKMEVLQGVLLYEARNTFNEHHYFNGIIPPPNLESLTVICPTLAIFEWLDILVDHKTDAPYLCEIILLCRCGYGIGPKEFEGDVATRVFEKLKELGVDVSVVEEKVGAFAAQARKDGSVWEADWSEDGWVEGLFGEEMG